MMNNKHDANVRKNGTINFQIGLIASLLFVFLLIETYTKVPVNYSKKPVQTVPEETIHTMDRFKVEPKKKTYKKVYAKAKKPKETKIPDEIEIIKNDVLEPNNHNNTVPTDNASPEVPVDTIESIPNDEVPENVPFVAVERVPVFPGCEVLGSNEERAACFNEKVRKIVMRKFNTSLGNKYGLTGAQRIQAQFDVAKDGSIQNVKVRAPHPKLEQEARRVIGLLPNMIPGMQRDTPVAVKFQLPIYFKVED
ncbi:energy transducer TonB [Aquimarina sp. ERC-38]|uniref:energy transducer TonB n=1 Tax=Aquimarina sp. ERC-38 TaxID=2949996 RepID=UPI002248176A|nr:energy transducer TonB [Aquimarina sp. ERC-38]UZO81204.1 energy transducer TonB [Aquimarina sp. ERC-38]